MDQDSAIWVQTKALSIERETEMRDEMLKVSWDNIGPGMMSDDCEQSGARHPSGHWRAPGCSWRALGGHLGTKTPYKTILRNLSRQFWMHFGAKSLPKSLILFIRQFRR